MERDRDVNLDLAELGTASGDTRGGQDGLVPELRQFWATGGISDD